jgi:hypothetical protein
VASEIYFLGAVALVNSLRLLGHTEPIFVLDRGLSPAQRELLGSEVSLVPSPGDTTPFLLKTVAPLSHPAEVMVLLDADIIVTRPFTELIERAAPGRVLAVEHGQDRFFPEWGELLGGTARHRRYVSSSLVLLGGEPGRRVIHVMDQLQGRIDIGRTPFSGLRPDFTSAGDEFSEMGKDDPFFFADQDVLNAVLATEIDPGLVEELDRRQEAIVPFTGLRIVDEQALSCAYEDGSEPQALHHVLAQKPWLEPTIPGVYSQFMQRLLLGRDVAIQVPRRDLPLHLQPGAIAGARRWYRGPLTTSLRAVRDRVRGLSGPVEG